MAEPGAAPEGPPRTPGDPRGSGGPHGSGGPRPPGGAPQGTILTVAPAATDLPHLLRTAIDAEQVGAARIHLAADQPEVDDAVAAIRTQTGLVITADSGTPADGLVDRLGPDFAEVVLADSLAGPALLSEVARIAREHRGPVSVGGRGAAALPVLLAALAVGLHLRAGTADLSAAGAASPPADLVAPSGPRDDIALIARAAGLARIAGRPALPLAQAREVLGVP